MLGVPNWLTLAVMNISRLDTEKFTLSQFFPVKSGLNNTNQIRTPRAVLINITF